MRVSWRIAAIQLPSTDDEVLVTCNNGQRLICYYDGEYWYDAIYDNVIQSPLFWMHIPLLPGE